MRALKFVGMGILGIAGITLFIFVTMHLWNWLVPALFHGPIITFWQSAGLLILSKILFSGFGHRGHGHHHGKDCHSRENHRKKFWDKFGHHSSCEDKTVATEQV